MAEGAPVTPSKPDEDKVKILGPTADKSGFKLVQTSTGSRDRLDDPLGLGKFIKEQGNSTGTMKASDKLPVRIVLGLVKGGLAISEAEARTGLRVLRGETDQIPNDSIAFDLGVIDKSTPMSIMVMVERCKVNLLASALEQKTGKKLTDADVEDLEARMVLAGDLPWTKAHTQLEDAGNILGPKMFELGGDAVPIYELAVDVLIGVATDGLLEEGVAEVRIIAREGATGTKAGVKTEARSLVNARKLLGENSMDALAGGAEAESAAGPGEVRIILKDKDGTRRILTKRKLTDAEKSDIWKQLKKNDLKSVFDQDTAVPTGEPAGVGAKGKPKEINASQGPKTPKPTGGGDAPVQPGGVPDSPAGGLPDAKPRGAGASKLLPKDIPSYAENPAAFEAWFDSQTPEQLAEYWKDPQLRAKIKNELLGPGGEHEYLMRAEAPKWKEWGVSAKELREKFSVAFEDLDEVALFKHSRGTRGSLAPGSKAAHNELQKIIQESASLDEFKKNLVPWADKWLKGRVKDLPPALQ